MKKGFTLVICLLSLLSCKGRKGVKDNSYQFYTLQVISGSELLLTPQINADTTIGYYEYEVINGNKAVFVLAYLVGDSTYADGGSSETVVFEIDTSAANFRIVDQDFKNYKGLYEKSCFCIDESANKAFYITKGEVSGTKISTDTWRLRAKVGMIDIEDTVRVSHKEIISFK